MIWIISIAVYVSAAILMSRYFGPAAAIVLYAVATSLLTLLAGQLLANADVDTITWKNRVAGFLLPWASFVGGGQLKLLMIKNALASAAFAAIVVVGDHWILRPGKWKSNPANVADSIHWTDSGLLYWLTVACWIVILASWLWMLRSFLTHQSDAATALMGKPVLWIPLALPPILVAFSLGLKYSNRPLAALLSVGIPVLIVLVPLLLMTAVFLFYQLTGKPIRWN